MKEKFYGFTREPLSPAEVEINAGLNLNHTEISAEHQAGLEALTAHHEALAIQYPQAICQGCGVPFEVTYQWPYSVSRPLCRRCWREIEAAIEEARLAQMSAVLATN